MVRFVLLSTQFSVFVRDHVGRKVVVEERSATVRRGPSSFSLFISFSHILPSISYIDFLAYNNYQYEDYRLRFQLIIEGSPLPSFRLLVSLPAEPSSSACLVTFVIRRLKGFWIIYILGTKRVAG